MNKRTLLLFSIALLLSTSIRLTGNAQENAQPFARFEQAVKAEQDGFVGNKAKLSAIFNDERNRLGDKFETELIEYIGADVELHYWVSWFLIAPTYLHGNQPLPQLSLEIKRRALEMLRDKTDRESLGDIVRLSVTAAILCDSLGLLDEALIHKQRAARLIAVDISLNASFPAIDERERSRYETLEARQSRVIGNSPAPPAPRENGARSGSRNNSRSVSGGILNGRATSLPQPPYPPVAIAAKIQGQVVVQITVDESGDVIAATAVSGPALLRQAAAQAARGAKFAPTTLSGAPVRVTGVLIYKFTLDAQGKPERSAPVARRL